MQTAGTWLRRWTTKRRPARIEQTAAVLTTGTRVVREALES